MVLQYLDAVKGMGAVVKAARGASDALGDTEEASKDTGKELDKTTESTKKSSDGFTVWKGVLSNLASTAITKLISAVGELAGKIVDLTKTAVGDYAQYEQMVGGVETLFQGSADKVIQYAQNAYQTAGLSANEYMDTVTSFAASLLQGLGGDTAAAAELANTAITDMADNVNKMGTDMSSVQYAYQGFAKQNYTMLDNLKLGYGGTQAEMARLINDSGVLGDTITVTAETVNQVDFDKIIQAIHVIQSEMGITGTTALEAGTTISGSWSSVQAKLENISTRIGGELAPVVMNFLSQLSDWLDTIDWDAFADSLGDALNSLLSWLGTVDWSGVFEGLLNAITTIIEVVSWIIDNSDLVISIIGAIAAAVAALNIVLNANPLGAIVAIITAVIAAVVLLISHIDEISAAVQSAWDFVVGVISGVADWIYNNVIAPVVNFFQGLWQTVSGFFVNLWNDIVGVFTGAANWYNQNVVMPIVNFFQGLWQTVSGFFSNLWNDIVGIFTGAANWFYNTIISPVVNAFQGLWSSITNIFNSIKDTITNVWNAIWNTIKSVINSIIGGVEGMVNGVINGINFILGGISDIANAVGGLIGLDPVNLRLSPVSLPRLAQGGVLERGQVGLLEGSGAEAVVPLEQNTGWIRRIAQQLDSYAGSPNQTELTRRLDDLEGTTTAILNLLQTFFPQFLDALDVTLVLNDGALVAKLAPKLDKRLAVLAKRKGAAYG